MNEVCNRMWGTPKAFRYQIQDLLSQCMITFVTLFKNLIVFFQWGTFGDYDKGLLFFWEGILVVVNFWKLLSVEENFVYIFGIQVHFE